MQVIECEQGTAEWFAARLGKLSASRMADVIAKTKTGYSTSRANYAAELVAERLTGRRTEGFKSQAMEWGSEQEAAARALYAWNKDIEVQPVGLVCHPTIAMAVASPDGLVAEDGQIEIKAPLTATHISTLLDQKIPGKYFTQIQWQLACTQREWCDFISYDPRMPQEMEVFIQRVWACDTTIADLEKEARIFLAEVEETVRQLKAKYQILEAAE